MRATQGSSDSAYYWLVTKFDGTRMEFLTVEGVEGLVLPVFGSRKGANEFIVARRGRERWRARPTGTGELISVLLGARPEVKRVVLDPPRQTLERPRIGPVCRGREGFIASLLEESRATANPGRKRVLRSGVRSVARIAHPATSQN